MKKLLFLIAAAIGIVAVARSRSEQLKAGTAKVTNDPRVQSALATASEKAGPVVSNVAEKAGPVVSSVGEKVSHATEAASSFAQERLHHGSPETPADAAPVDVPEVPPAAERLVEEQDPVSAPEFTGTETEPGTRPAE